MRNQKISLAEFNIFEDYFYNKSQTGQTWDDLDNELYEVIADLKDRGLVEPRFFPISYSKDLAAGFKPLRIKWEELYRMVKSEGHYSHLQFKDGYRKQENFMQGCELIILDIDDQWSLDQAKTFLDINGLKALIATTRNHQKQKDKLPPCDRFRIILPTIKPFKGNGIEYSVMMKNICGFFQGIPDIKAAKDCARFFYGNPNAEYWYIEGGELDLKQFPKSEPKPKITFYKKLDNEKITEWFIAEAVPGNRNETLTKARLYAKDNGLDPIWYVRQINSKLQEPIEEGELNQLLRTKK